MFGIGMPEMLLILAVALIVFGPKRLPELAKSLGRALGEFKRATSDLKESIETETGLDEVRNQVNNVKKDIKSQVDLSVEDSNKAQTEPKPTASEDPLAKVKTAFDQMNDESVPSDSENSLNEKAGETGDDPKDNSKTTSERGLDL